MGAGGQDTVSGPGKRALARKACARCRPVSAWPNTPGVACLPGGERKGQAARERVSGPFQETREQGSCAQGGLMPETGSHMAAGPQQGRASHRAPEPSQRGPPEAGSPHPWGPDGWAADRQEASLSFLAPADTLHPCWAGVTRARGHFGQPSSGDPEARSSDLRWPLRPDGRPRQGLETWRASRG